MPFTDKQRFMLEEQINVLATNVEILNQKLLQTPEAVMSPGEAEIKKAVMYAIHSVNQIQDVLKSGNRDMRAYLEHQYKIFAGQIDTVKVQTEELKNEREQLAQTIQVLQSSVHAMTEELKQFPEEKRSLSGEITQLQSVADELANLNRAWLGDLLNRIEQYTTTIDRLNTSLESYNEEIRNVTEQKITQIGEQTSEKIHKLLIYTIIIILILSFAIPSLVLFLLGK